MSRRLEYWWRMRPGWQKAAIALPLAPFLIVVLVVWIIADLAISVVDLMLGNC